MYFHEIGRNRYRIHTNKDDTTFYGTIEKHEYVSINIATGKRVTKRYWQAHGASGLGWRQPSFKPKQFKTREGAGEFLLKEAKIPYATKAIRWSNYQGESASLKAAKAKV